MQYMFAPVGGPTFTWAGKPTTYPAGWPVFISDLGSFWYYTGSRWKPMNGRAIIASLSAASSAIANTATIILQKQMPAGLLQDGDRLRFWFSGQKSGTTDALLGSIYIGAAGTTSDTVIKNGTSLISATNRSGAFIIDLKRIDATHVQEMQTTSGYGGTSGAVTSSMVVTNADNNALYASLGIRSSSTTDTVQLLDAQIELIAN